MFYYQKTHQQTLPIGVSNKVFNQTIKHINTPTLLFHYVTLPAKHNNVIKAIKTVHFKHKIQHPLHMLVRL